MSRRETKKHKRGDRARESEKDSSVWDDEDRETGATFRRQPDPHHLVMVVPGKGWAITEGFGIGLGTGIGMASADGGFPGVLAPPPPRSFPRFKAASLLSWPLKQ